MSLRGISLFALIAGAAIVLLERDAVGQVGRLNGIYSANDGSKLLVEEVPVNDGQRLTLVVRDVEMSVWRARKDLPFIYRHNGCSVVIVTSSAGKTQQISFESTGLCSEADAPLNGLTIAYGRQPEKSNLLSQQLSRNELFELQFRLNQLGFEVGDPSGLASPRTIQEAAAYARKTGLPLVLSRQLLERSRLAASTIQGFTREDGQIDLLVFTDEGTAQIVRVENWGLIHKTNSSTYVRDRDRDGAPILAEHFGVSSMERRNDIPYERWTSFGYKLFFPTPPEGQRLEIEQTIIRPMVHSDGSVGRDTIVFKNPFLKAPPPGPWYWYTGPEDKTDLRLQGNWTMTIGQREKILLSRSFDLRRR